MASPAPAPGVAPAGARSARWTSSRHRKVVDLKGEGEEQRESVTAVGGHAQGTADGCASDQLVGHAGKLLQQQLPWRLRWWCGPTAHAHVGKELLQLPHLELNIANAAGAILWKQAAHTQTREHVLLL